MLQYFSLTFLLPIFTAAVYETEAVSVDDCPAYLPRDRYLRAFGDSCYVFVLWHSREWPTAERECEARHGHLVTIRDAATNQFLYNTMVSELHFRGVVFIGLSDSDTENDWRWVDGSRPTYTNWSPGQPGIASAFEDCATMDTSAGSAWYDASCEDILFISHDHYFICEYPIVKTATTTTSSSTTTTTTTAAPTTTTTVTMTTTTPSPTTTTEISTVSTTATTTTTSSATTTTTTAAPATTTTVTMTTTTPSPTTTTEITRMSTTSLTSTRPTSVAVTVPPTTACPPVVCPQPCDFLVELFDLRGCKVCVCESRRTTSTMG